MRTRNYIESSGIKYDFPPVNIALKDDFEEILSLQKLAFQSVAETYHDFDIPPITQTLEAFHQEAKSAIILKVVENRKIVGSVRAFEKEGTCYIGKVIVHPDFQNRGIGKKLMGAIEKCFKVIRYELFTGHLNEKNLALYEKLGYKRFKEERITDDMQLIYLEKLC